LDQSLVGEVWPMAFYAVACVRELGAVVVVEQRCTQAAADLEVALGGGRLSIEVAHAVGPRVTMIHSKEIRGSAAVGESPPDADELDVHGQGIVSVAGDHRVGRRGVDDEHVLRFDGNGIVGTEAELHARLGCQLRDEINAAATWGRDPGTRDVWTLVRVATYLAWGGDLELTRWIEGLVEA